MRASTGILTGYHRGLDCFPLAYAWITTLFLPLLQLEVTDSNSRVASGMVFPVGLTCWVLLCPPHSYHLLAPASSFFFIFDYTFPSKTKVSLNTTSDSELQARTSLNMVQEVKSVSVLGLDSCCPTSETSLHGAGELDSHGARAGHAVKSNLVLRMGLGTWGIDVEAGALPQGWQQRPDDNFGNWCLQGFGGQNSKLTVRNWRQNKEWRKKTSWLETRSVNKRSV